MHNLYFSNNLILDCLYTGKECMSPIALCSSSTRCSYASCVIHCQRFIGFILYLLIWPIMLLLEPQWNA